jgi:hypothetical protein
MTCARRDLSSRHLNRLSGLISRWLEDYYPLRFEGAGDITARVISHTSPFSITTSWSVAGADVAGGSKLQDRVIR